MRCSRLPLVALGWALVFALPIGSAASQENRVHGHYAAASSVGCGSAGGLGSGSGAAVLSFDGAGRGMARGTTVEIDLLSNSLEITSATEQGSFPFTYTVGQNGSITVNAVNISSQIEGAGITCVIDREVLHGFVSMDDNTLTLVSTQPNVETVTCSNGVTAQETCHRALVLIKIGP